jgi:DNA-binding transcriptional LysR family regulator
VDRLGNIEAFVAAAELGSFTRAAARLRLTPSALSRRIAQLRLFHRTTRTVKLSEDGRAFFERCRSALRDLRGAEEEMAGLRRRPSGLLRVEAPPVLGRHVLVPALPRFLSRHADVQVELRLRDHASDQVAEAIDVTLRMGPQPDSGLIGRRLGVTRMQVCGAPAYLRRKGTPRTVEALASHDRIGLLVHGRVLPWRLRERAAVREVEPGRRLVVDSGEALVDLAVGGAGLVWVCDFMMAHARKAGHLVEVLQQAACEEEPVHVTMLPSSHVLPKVRAFVQFMAGELTRSGVES